MSNTNDRITLDTFVTNDGIPLNKITFPFYYVDFTHPQDEPRRQYSFHIYVTDNVVSVTSGNNYNQNILTFNRTNMFQSLIAANTARLNYLRKQADDLETKLVNNLGEA